ncbi:MAG: histidine phosphatase family protein [Bacteroidota bacterium]
MIEIFLIRHGMTDYNKNGIVQGSGIDSNINMEGAEQARKFFSFYKHISFDGIYASTLKRTSQTLSPWLEKDIPHFHHAGLNEFNWGVYEGKKPREEDRVAYRSIVDSWQKGNWDVGAEGGETPNIAWARAVPFFKQLISNHQDQKLLICSHGRQIRIMLHKLTGINMEDASIYPHKNTGLSVLKLTDEMQAVAEKLNDATHLMVPV